MNRRKQVQTTASRTVQNRAIGLNICRKICIHVTLRVRRFLFHPRIVVTQAIKHRVTPSHFVRAFRLPHQFFESTRSSQPDRRLAGAIRRSVSETVYTLSDQGMTGTWPERLLQIGVLSRVDEVERQANRVYRFSTFRSATQKNAKCDDRTVPGV
jgi:hypothetical protein